MLIFPIFRCTDKYTGIFQFEIFWSDVTYMVPVHEHHTKAQNGTRDKNVWNHCSRLYCRWLADSLAKG